MSSAPGTTLRRLDSGPSCADEESGPTNLSQEAVRDQASITSVWAVVDQADGHVRAEPARLDVCAEGS